MLHLEENDSKRAKQGETPQRRTAVQISEAGAKYARGTRMRKSTQTKESFGGRENRRRRIPVGRMGSSSHERRALSFLSAATRQELKRHDRSTVRTQVLLGLDLSTIHKREKETTPRRRGRMAKNSARNLRLRGEFEGETR